jgi:phenylpropionate dioxygenase-like ring-hydroxylating dioxygenase large terminal subunit
MKIETQRNILRRFFELRDAFDGLQRGELALVPVTVAERFGVILASVGDSGKAVDVAGELAGLGTELADYGFERWRFFDQRAGVVDANWKLIHDTFLETYHVFSLHRDTLAPDMLSTPFVGEDFGPHSRRVVMRKEVTSLLERPESEWELRPFASIVYVLFPSVVINLPMSGHAELWEMIPSRRTRIARASRSSSTCRASPRARTSAHSGRRTSASPTGSCLRRTSASSRTSIARYAAD